MEAQLLDAMEAGEGCGDLARVLGTIWRAEPVLIKKVRDDPRRPAQGPATPRAPGNDFRLRPLQWVWLQLHPLLYTLYCILYTEPLPWVWSQLHPFGGRHGHGINGGIALPGSRALPSSVPLPTMGAAAHRHVHGDADASGMSFMAGKASLGPSSPNRSPSRLRPTWCYACAVFAGADPDGLCPPCEHVMVAFPYG